MKNRKIAIIRGLAWASLGICYWSFASSIVPFYEGDYSLRTELLLAGVGFWFFAILLVGLRNR